jgi:glycosyltransferase involved in cell wall biosynthesis
MNIGFDAKRAYENSTGLGHYSRTLVKSLATFYPTENYYLFAPKITDKFITDSYKNIIPIEPTGFITGALKGTWRKKWVLNDLLKNKIALYHGLSHQIPIDINTTKIKSIVTIHDLIFERYPEQFNKINVHLFRKKFTYACKNADKIIAISEQTKNDIINFYKIPENKIEVCYQSCDDIYRIEVSEAEKLRIKKLYNLPDQFFLYVGSVIERKNLLTIVEAIKKLKDTLNIPLVVIGNGSGYKQKVKKYIQENNLEKDVIFLSENTDTNKMKSFQSSADFPAIYQQAIAMIYPSVFEGFGIPVLEALCSKLPVITSNVSCLPEAGGDAAYYVNPTSANEIAAAMEKIYTDNDFADKMKLNGIIHAENFTQQTTADAVMKVYKSLC